MPRLSPEQYALLLAKRGPKRSERGSVPDNGPEAELHLFALRFCETYNLPVIHSRMDKLSRCTLGAPDLVLVVRGSVLLIEFKRKDGKLRPEQVAWHYLAECQGVKVNVIRSKVEFMNLMESVVTTKGGNNDETISASDV